MDIIRLKGTGDGVKIYMSPDADFPALLDALQEKLRAWRNFFGTGHCNMYFIGRNLNKSDTLRLETVVKALLPESNILYGEKKNMGSTIALPTELISVLEGKSKKPEEAVCNSEPKEEVKEEEDKNKEIRDFMEIREVVTNNFKSNRARLYEGRVKANRVVESDGHLILVGDVEEGGTLIANGNVIVLGKIEGSIQAGCMGNRNAYIIAMHLNPTDLRIAHANKKYDKTDDDTELISPKKAYLINNEICIEEFLLKS